MTLISVIFPVFNDPETLKATLPAIVAQSMPDGFQHEVIVVDDGSGPATADWLARQDDPCLRVIRHPRNLGRAAARNSGFRAARGDWVVFVDSDVLVRPDFLQAHARTAGILPQGAAECDVTLGPCPDTDHLRPALSRPIPRALPGPGHFTTQNVAVRTALLRQVSETPEGPFDAQTFPRYGWEDIDLDLRLRRLGVRRRRADAAVGFHHCPPFTPARLESMIAKEIDRAAMARRLFVKHPTLGVRMITQQTPLHRLLWEILSLGGLLNPRTLGPLLFWLSRHGRTRLAETIARNTILNPTYARNL